MGAKERKEFAKSLECDIISLDYVRKMKEEREEKIDGFKRANEAEKARKRARRRIKNSKNTRTQTRNSNDRYSKSERDYRSNKEQPKKYKGSIKKKVAALALAATTMAAGGILIFQNLQPQNQKATLQEVLGTGTSSLEELGLNSKIASRLEEIQNTLKNENLTNEEIIRLAPKINALQFDIVKSKSAKLLNVPREEIILFASNPDSDGNTRETVETDDKKYRSKDSSKKNQNTISYEFSDVIQDIAGMQGFMGRIQEGDFNRAKTIKSYNRYLKNISQFAASKLNIDEKGNITVESKKVSDLYKGSNETYIISQTQKDDDGR